MFVARDTGKTCWRKQYSFFGLALPELVNVHSDAIDTDTRILYILCQFLENPYETALKIKCEEYALRA